MNGWFQRSRALLLLAAALPILSAGSCPPKPSTAELVTKLAAQVGHSTDEIDDALRLARPASESAQRDLVNAWLKAPRTTTNIQVPRTLAETLSESRARQVVRSFACSLAADTLAGDKPSAADAVAELRNSLVEAHVPILQAFGKARSLVDAFERVAASGNPRVNFQLLRWQWEYC